MVVEATSCRGPSSPVAFPPPPQPNLASNEATVGTAGKNSAAAANFLVGGREGNGGHELGFLEAVLYTIANLGRSDLFGAFGPLCFSLSAHARDFAAIAKSNSVVSRVIARLAADRVFYGIASREGFQHAIAPRSRCFRPRSETLVPTDASIFCEALHKKNGSATQENRRDRQSRELVRTSGA